MKKISLIIAFLLLALILIPGGMASWGGTLDIEGEVGVIIPEPEAEAEPELEFTKDTEVNEEPDPEPVNDQEPEKLDLLISVTGEGSTEPAEGEHIYEQGEAVRLTASSDEGWKFVKWVLDSREYDSASLNITMDKEKKAMAVFEKEKSREYEKEQESDEPADDSSDDVSSEDEKDVKDEEEKGSDDEENLPEEDE